MSEEDIRVLKYIWDHRLLTSKQISSYDELISGSKYHSVLNKLSRWTQHNVLAKFEFQFMLQPGRYFNYYRISRLGYEILRQEGMLTESELEIDYTRFSKVSNMIHWFVTQDIVAQIHCLLPKFPFESMHPFTYPHNNSINNEALIIPDWVLKQNNRIVNIETDSGKERPQILDEKLAKYRKLAEQNIEFEYHVVIAVMDDSISYVNQYSENRLRRIGNIKNQMLMRPYLNQPNLHVYVVPLKQAARLGANILVGELPYSATERKKEIYKVVEQLWGKINKVFPYDVSECVDDIYPRTVKEQYHADKCYWLQDKENHNKRFRMLFVWMEEGNVKSLDRLHELVSVQSSSTGFKVPIDRIVAVYGREDELHRDVIGNKYEGVLFGSQDGWAKQLSKMPTFYEATSPYKLVGCELV